jgi:hydrogenase expression/formation protein HypE
MIQEKSYALGKLPADHLGRLLAQYAPTDPAVIVGPTIGEDAAVLAVSADQYVVVKSDPITFATQEIGWYAVHVNANDLVCTGARPRWWMATLLLPEGRATPGLVDSIFDQMMSACGQLGAQLIGGHTEITHGLDRPVIVGIMLGQVAPDKVISTSGAQPGDDLVLTKGIAVEGTAIIARELGAALVEHFGRDFVDRCAGFLHEPGISVARDSQVAIEASDGRVHSMHDPTEGGLATGLYEMATASGCGLEVDGDSLPILPETRALCDHLGLDPLGLIASGSLLIAVDPAASAEMVEGLVAEGIDARVIGRVLAPGAGVTMSRGGRPERMPAFEADELTRLFGSEGG